MNTINNKRLENLFNDNLLYAVIDIGSNSVRLMLWKNNTTLSKQVITTRLSEGMGKSLIIQPNAIKKTVEAVELFFDVANKRGADKIYIFGTEAVRKAVNKSELVDKIKIITKINLDIISGEVEAELAMLGCLQNANGGVIDIGGASTEVVFCENGQKTYGKSIDIGAVKLKDVAGQDRVLLDNIINEKLHAFKNLPKGQFYGVGGTITTLSSMCQQLKIYDSSKTHGYLLSLDKVSYWADKLFNASLEDRKKFIGLEAKRAEIIHVGSEILLLLMKQLKIDNVIVSEKDNLEGYLIKTLQNQLGRS